MVQFNLLRCLALAAIALVLPSQVPVGMAQVPAQQLTVSEGAGCLQGDRRGQYQGDRALTRAEFAAGLNACLQKIERLLPSSDSKATRAELERVLQKQQDLNQELRQLSDRVGNLDSGTAAP